MNLAAGDFNDSHVPKCHWIHTQLSDGDMGAEGKFALLKARNARNTKNVEAMYIGT